MKIHPTIAQKHFLGAQADLVIGGGGSGAGKTTALLAGAVLRAHEKPGVEIAMMWPEVREVWFPGGYVDQALKNFGDEGFLKKSHREWYIMDSVIRFMGANEVKAQAGLRHRFDRIFIDELQGWNPEDFIRIGHMLAEGGRIYATCTAAPGWLGMWLEAEGLVKENGFPLNKIGAMVCLGGSRKREKVETMAFVPFTAEDNPHIAEGYMGLLGSMKDWRGRLTGCWR